jgi:Holliday junction resolvase RusA-like endonuclease
VTQVRFFIEGIPKPQPRARVSWRNADGSIREKPLRYTPATIDGWKSCVEAFGMQHRPSAPMEGPLVVMLQFFLEPPAGPGKPGAAATRVRDGDVDNLAKTVLDVLQKGGFYGNDAQVVTLLVSKEYAEPWVGLGGCGVLIRSVPWWKKLLNKAADLFEANAA